MRAWMRVFCVLLLATGAGLGCSNGASDEDGGGRSAGQMAADPSLEPPTEGSHSETSAPGTSAAPTVPGGAAGASAGPAMMASSSFSDGAEPSFAPGTAMVGAAGAGATPAEGASASSSKPGGGDGTIQSGTLTAGAWDDNRNFVRFTQYRSDLLQNNLPGAVPFTDAEHAASHDEFSGARDAHQKLDIALVIDTTGSMGDEISYLQAEFLAISQAIDEDYPDAEQRWAVVLYRDQGDQYVVRTFDFTTDASEFRTILGEQSAGGGGDLPEAPDAALAEMVGLDWRPEADVARLAFWVADAPHHSANADAMAEAVRDTHQIGVHLYPVASSGIDELTELTMRSSAQLTGGRYMFLTDDSGVGGAHKEPTIPCYFVTRLDHGILRMVDVEMSGEYREPTGDEIIRTGGDPQDGSCTLASGDEVEVF